MSKIWAISDLHFDFFNPQKRMDSLNHTWRYHPQNLLGNWNKRVASEDWVLIPGDISWGMKPGEIAQDYKELANLPGKKLISPGNHDLGVWKTTTAIHKFCSAWPNIHPLRNQAYRIAPGAGQPGLVIAASKGFLSPEDERFGSSFDSAATLDREKKRFQRAIGRLHAALAESRALQRPGDKLCVMVHYPPFANLNQENAFSRAIEKSNADLCLYGHLHYQKEWLRACQENRNGTQYLLVAADYLNMKPLKLGELTDIEILLTGDK